MNQFQNLNMSIQVLVHKGLQFVTQAKFTVTHTEQTFLFVMCTTHIGAIFTA